MGYFIEVFTDSWFGRLIGLTILFIFGLVFYYIFYIFFELTHTCIRSHQEFYYDTTGTSLFAATKNPVFLAQNGYRIRIVCDEYTRRTK